MQLEDTKLTVIITRSSVPNINNSCFSLKNQAGFSDKNFNRLFFSAFRLTYEEINLVPNHSALYLVKINLERNLRDPMYCFEETRGWARSSVIKIRFFQIRKARVRVRFLCVFCLFTSI